MAQFIITAPDGYKYKITAPDNATNEEVLAYAQQNFNQSEGGVKGNAGGGARAYAYGLSGGAVPFGNVITSGLGAALAKMASPITGDPSSFKELYDQAQADTKATQDANPGATLAGNLTGILSTLPLASAKVIGGGSAATEGVRGLINAIPQGLSKVNNLVGRSEIAAKGILPGIANTLIRGAKSGAVAAPVGALYAAGEADAGNRMEAAKGGAMVAGGLGFGLPVGLSTLGGVKNGILNSITPAVDDAQKAVIALAKKYKIPVSLDDVSKSEFYKTLISEGEKLPFSGATKIYEKTQKALNVAVAKTFGQEASAVTPEVISKAYDDLGAKFKSSTSGKRFDVGDEFYSGLDDLTNRVSRGDFGKDGKEFLQTNIDRVKSIIDENGVIKGERLDKLRREFAQTARERYDDIGNLADNFEEMLVGIIGQGDDAVKKSIQETKYQYKNLKTVQRLALKDQVDGNIRPDLLTGAVKAKFGEDAFARGEAGELGDLARVSQLIKSKIPNSGTSQRTFAKGLLTGNVTAAIPTALYGGIPGLAMQGVATGIGLGTNRLLQNRNASEKVLEQALKSKVFLPKTTNPLIPYGSGLLGSATQ